MLPHRPPPRPPPPSADAPNLRARNKEGPPLFNEVSAELIPEGKSASKVRGGRWRAGCKRGSWGAGLLNQAARSPSMVLVHCWSHSPLQSQVKVQFKQFKLLGLIPVNAPASASGERRVAHCLQS